MNGDGDAIADELKPIFYIGHHDTKRTEVTAHLLQQAQDCNVSGTCINAKLLKTSSMIWSPSLSQHRISIYVF